MTTRNFYPHMCRMDHEEIGHRDSNSERCPVCRRDDEIDDLRARAEKAERVAVWATSKATNGYLAIFHNGVGYNEDREMFIAHNSTDADIYRALVEACGGGEFDG